MFFLHADIKTFRFVLTLTSYTVQQDDNGKYGILGFRPEDLDSTPFLIFQAIISVLCRDSMHCMVYVQAKI